MNFLRNLLPPFIFGQSSGFAGLWTKNRKRSHGKSGGHPYIPGTIGLSAVSSAIWQDYGVIRNRRERKLIAKRTGKTFKVYYNGPMLRVKNY